MLDQFNEHINNRLGFLKNKKLLLACSGGVDSMVLAHVMCQFNFTIAIAHCNFSLRGVESDTDMDFVKSWAEKQSIPFFVKTFNTKEFAADHKLSIQMAARDLRYEWFETILNDCKYDYLLTAHHADDNLETFLINLSRGTGLRGLLGIPEKNHRIVRPLLPYSKDQLLAYAKKNSLCWREDNSNNNTKYLRNKLRHHIVPAYKEVSSSTLKNFNKTQKYLRGSQTLVDDYLVLIRNLVMTEQAEGFVINITKLINLPHYEMLLHELLSPFNFNAWKPNETAGVYVIAKNTKSIKIPVRLNFSEASSFKITNTHTFFVDYQKLDYPLQLRPWKEGDFFHPLGMKGKKKLSKFFKDEKLSLVAKSNIWVLCSNHKIVWVVGMRGDERFKVTKQTKTILQIDYLTV